MILANSKNSLQIIPFSECTIIGQQAKMTQETGTKFVFGNWALRGRGHVIRLLMEHLKIPYEERIYKTPQSWYEEPLFKNNPNMQLPYLIDDDFVIDGAIPVLAYILRSFGHQNFFGESIQEQAKVDMHLWSMESLFKKLVCLGTKNDVTVEELKSLKQNVWTQVMFPKLKVIEDSLALGRWCLPSLSVMDFDIYEFVNYLRIIFPSKISELPMMEYIERRVSQLPSVRAYLGSIPCRSYCFLPVEMCKRFKGQPSSN